MPKKNNSTQDENRWIIPCSPSIYDAEAAFKKYGSIIWHQDCNIQVKDVVYVYITAPVKEIRCKCVVTDANIPFDSEEDDEYTIDNDFCNKKHKRYMSLQLIEIYDNPLLSYDAILYNGLNGPLRSQRRVSSALQKYIDDATSCEVYATKMKLE